ncbi:maker193, partial [Drosophila busckii]
MFYEQYKATRRRYPNLPIYKRAKEPMQLPSKFVKRTQRKFKQHDFDYEDCSSRHESLLYCNMCGSRFEKSCQLELHTLEECRKYLLATLLL